MAITMGDPAGIGPEVVLRAILHPLVQRRISPLLFGDLGVWRAAARRLRLPLALVAAGGERGIAVHETSALSERERVPGRPCRAGGEAAYRAILAAARAVQKGDAAALVTAPVNKANVAAAGHRFAGHTELLARLAGAARVRMMMAGPRLRVVLATTHVAVRRVPALLTRSRVRDTILVASEALRARFGIDGAAIAVCALNPHGGEAGLFGREEAETIRPAVHMAVRRGVRAVGPLAADTVFAQAVAGKYDAVVCMYHDQGLAPFKLLHFADGVNVTLGLPFVRTSPDHGTAYDIAGSGRADPASMMAALRMAAAMAKGCRRRRSRCRTF